MSKIDLYILVQTQDIGVISSLHYKIVLSRLVFKLKILDDLWISDNIKKNSKWMLTHEIRPGLTAEK